MAGRGATKERLETCGGGVSRRRWRASSTHGLFETALARLLNPRAFETALARLLNPQSGTYAATTSTPCQKATWWRISAAASDGVA
ncbi:hypothetical protein GCM10009747_34160 [Agromyces humatus]|uniref:Uncharacterized protein n=1 Tax=Agromyces humatus TaxID=279573 RepID=A0ABP4X4I7_9MICO